MKIITTAAVIMLSACAPGPGAVAPVSMAGSYDAVSCDQIQPLLASEQSRVAILSSQQQAAATADAVGVFLILVPVSSVTGGNQAGELAEAKGRVNELEARRIEC